MFRPMRRINQQLPREECIAILKSEVRGVLSVLVMTTIPMVSLWTSIIPRRMAASISMAQGRGIKLIPSKSMTKSLSV